MLFIMFYIATYKKASSRKTNKKGNTPAVSSMKQSAAMVADSCSGVEHKHMNSSLVARK